MANFKYVSLFSGVGGFEQALNKLGGVCVFASEIDKFAAQAYETLYGGEHLHGDITKIDAKNVPDRELLVGGFPCQSFSVAGKRKGLEDARGTLFFDIARIASEKQPSALLLENVKGLVNHDKGNTLDLMVRTLNDIGYVVDFDVLNSKYFGVPQNRERIFIVAIRKDLINAESFSEEATKGQTIVPKGKRRIGEWANVFNFDWPDQSEVTTRLRDILEPEVDEKYYLDEEKTARLVAQLDERDKEEAPSVIHNIYGGFKESKPRIFKEVSPTVRTSAGGGHLPSLLEDTTQEEGIPIREATTKGYAVAAEGDAVNFQFPESKTRRGRVGKQMANTLEASSINQGVVTSRYRIRKLTPKECFRLQGFPDEAHQALVDAGISDSQRYKMAGNAVTVSVIVALGERLIPLIQ